MYPGRQGGVHVGRVYTYHGRRVHTHHGRRVHTYHGRLVHTQGGYNPGYTHRKGITQVIHTGRLIPTQGGLYTPREAYTHPGRLIYPGLYTREAYIPGFIHQGGYIHTREAITHQGGYIHTREAYREGIPRVCNTLRILEERYTQGV